MQELINIYLEASLINYEHVLEKVEELSRISTIPTSKLLKFKLLLNKIVRIRYRVHIISSHPPKTNNVEHKKYKN